MTPTTRILIGDARRTLATLKAGSVNCCVTSPPYWGQRSYTGRDDELGAERHWDLYVHALRDIFLGVHRVLKDDGTLWLNLGDVYGKGKQLLGLPWRVALALQDSGWILRSEIIWSKTACMPESVTDRPSRSHEHIFLLSKSLTYHYDASAISVPVAPSTASDKRDPDQAGRPDRDYPGAPSRGAHLLGTLPTRNRRTVWRISPEPYKGSHCAAFPTEIPEIAIRAGCIPGGVVLDPFGGVGTTAFVANRLGRSAILCELNPNYAHEAAQRILDDAPMFTKVEVVGEPLHLE